MDCNTAAAGSEKWIQIISVPYLLKSWQMLWTQSVLFYCWWLRCPYKTKTRVGCQVNDPSQNVWGKTVDDWRKSSWIEKPIVQLWNFSFSFFKKNIYIERSIWNFCDIHMWPCHVSQLWHKIFLKGRKKLVKVEQICWWHASLRGAIECRFNGSIKRQSVSGSLENTNQPSH